MFLSLCVGSKRTHSGSISQLTPRPEIPNGKDVQGHYLALGGMATAIIVVGWGCGDRVVHHHHTIITVVCMGHGDGHKCNEHLGTTKKNTTRLFVSQTQDCIFFMYTHTHNIYHSSHCTTRIDSRHVCPMLPPKSTGKTLRGSFSIMSASITPVCE